MHLIIIFNSFDWLVMLYKVSPINNVWSFMDGPPIKLWKVNFDGSPKLPTQISSLVPYLLILRQWCIEVCREFFLCQCQFNQIHGISEAKCATYTMNMLYVEYWEDILLHLSKSLPPQNSIIVEGFYPSKHWRFNYTRGLLPSTMEVIDLEDLIMCSYYGHRNLRPFLAYTIFKDINNGDFVIMKPHDPILAHVWMGRT